MSKITLNTVASGYNLATLNANFQAIEDYINDNVLSRYNPSGDANHLRENIDANGKRIFNLPTAVSGTEPVTLNQLLSLADITAFVGRVHEKQVATSGQTVFNLATISYEPGVDNLDVYRNGSYIDPGQYVETDTNTVTFTYEANVDDEYVFVVNQRAVSADVVRASSVTYETSDGLLTNLDTYLDSQSIKSISTFISNSWLSVDRVCILSFYEDGNKEKIYLIADGTTGNTQTTNTTSAIITAMGNNKLVTPDGRGWYIQDTGKITTYTFGAVTYAEDPSFDNSACVRAMLSCFGYCRRPAGSFRYKTTVTIKTDQYDICEAGDNYKGHIAYIDDINYLYLVGADGNKSTAHTRIKVQGYHFILYSQQMSASTNYIIDADRGYMNEFVDITFGDGGYGYSNGVTLNNGNLHTFIRCRWLRSTGYALGSAVRMVREDGYGSVGSLQLNSCQFERAYSGTTGSTIYLENVRGVDISADTHFEVSGIYLYSCAGVRVKSNWFQSSVLVEDVRSFDNEFDVSAKDSYIHAMGWSSVRGSTRGFHDLAPYYDMRIGTKVGSRISSSYSASYGASKSFSYGATGDDVFFAVHIRNKSEATLSNIQIRIKDNADVTIASSPVFALTQSSAYSDSTGANTFRQGYTWMHTERVAGTYLWVDVVDATSGTTLSTVQCTVFASRCVNRNARFLEGGGSNSGWVTAGASPTTPLVTTQNTTNTYSSGQLVCTPGSTSAWSMSQQLLLDPGKTYLMIASGNCSSGDEPGIKAEPYHNATVANNYINSEYAYNNNSDSESWLDNKFVVASTIRALDNDSSMFVSLGNLSGHSGGAIYFDWIAVIDVTP